MTEAPKPLTLDEIAAINYDAAMLASVTSAPIFSAATVRRFLATLDARDEQIKRLRKLLIERGAASEALAATEPKP